VLIEIGGFAEGAVGATMLAFGAGSTVGIFMGGRLADLAPNRAIAAGFGATERPG